MSNCPKKRIKALVWSLSNLGLGFVLHVINLQHCYCQTPAKLKPYLTRVNFAFACHKNQKNQKNKHKNLYQKYTSRNVVVEVKIWCAVFPN